MQSFTAVAKALADDSRARALMALRHGELCLAQLIELLGLAPSTVSKHMSVLVQAGLAEVRKDGRWHWYRLASATDRPQVRMALKWCNAALRNEPAIASDDERVQAIRAMDVQELCRRYKQREPAPAQAATVNTRPYRQQPSVNVFSQQPQQVWNRTG
jgi:ArsR family transcriptional regulator